MHKKVEPTRPSFEIAQFPHCDQRVLHAPGECQYCDKHGDWQALRLAWGIAFTGYEPDEKEFELPCPATRRRQLVTVNAWGGNVPKQLDAAELTKTIIKNAKKWKFPNP